MNDKKNEDYIEIDEDDVEILGQDGIYRKYKEHESNIRLEQNK